MLRFGFITCVKLGLSCMETIYQCGGRLEFVGTLHDNQARDKSGRIYLDEFCGTYAVPLHKFRNINDLDAVERIGAASLDWLFVIGWSQIARAPVLAATRLGVLGMHPTLLPVGRGRAAVPWAILLGLEQTGVTLFQLDEGVDTGAIIAQIQVPIGAGETAATLYQKVDEAHRELIRANWASLSTGRLAPRPQDHASATEWPGRTPDQGRLDRSMALGHAERLVRAVTRPYPGAFIEFGGRRLRVWKASILPHGDRHESCSTEYPLLEFEGGYLQVLEGQWETHND
jgi:methionyl-tRNA formyltransferase